MKSTDIDPRSSTKTNNPKHEINRI